jgi:hypothetical protein
MGEWISVESELPKNASNGVHDSFRVLVRLDKGCLSSSDPLDDVDIVRWMDNQFTGYPRGATRVVEWMYIPS